MKEADYFEQERHENEELQKIFPLASSWRQLYTFVLVELIVVIGLLYLFSQVFS